MTRFVGPGNFASYCRCVDAKRLSNGKKKDDNNAKNGNAYLAWAFVEAAHFAVRFYPAARRAAASEERWRVPKKHRLDSPRAGVNALFRKASSWVSRPAPTYRGLDFCVNRRDGEDRVESACRPNEHI